MSGIVNKFQLNIGVFFFKNPPHFIAKIRMNEIVNKNKYENKKIEYRDFEQVTRYVSEVNKMGHEGCSWRGWRRRRTAP